ncbi:MAG: hypothetical protein D6767_03355 [Candidatus Hydrogenedentota bacterium]|nr:MAG: hypothetical protein D6767_03355 [Candidatus Hydrogenedentota bacterium]
MPFLFLLGTIHLAVGLLLAWLLVMTLYLEVSLLKKVFVSPRDLIRSHIDFLMMSLFLFLFSLFFSYLQTEPSFLLKILLTIGPFGNAAGFLVLAVKPDIEKSIFSFYGILFGLIFTATTLGFCLAIYEISQAYANH